MGSTSYKDPENLKARLKESYDTIAPKYNSWTVEHAHLRLDYIQKLIDMLPKGDQQVKVLELGVGAGVPSVERFLSLPNYTVTANDMSSTQIRLGKEKLGEERVTWIESDMMSLSFPEASFDAVVGFYSLIHLPRSEQEVLLGRIARWLRPGGYFLANFAEEADQGAVMEKWLHEKGWMFWSAWGAEATLDKIKQVGLEVVVNKVEQDEVDARFLWAIAKKI